jgi:Na+/H+ antiporter NhaD/arsenite permease-like protein
MIWSYVSNDYFWTAVITAVVSMLALFVLLQFHFYYSIFRWQTDPTAPPLLGVMPESRPHKAMLILVSLCFFGIVLIFLFGGPIGLILGFGIFISYVVWESSWAHALAAPPEPVAPPEPPLTDVAKEILLRELRKKPDDH